MPCKLSTSAVMFIVVASVAVSVGAGAAVATAKRDQHVTATTHPVHGVHAAHRWHHRPHVVRRNVMPVYGRMSEYDYNHPRPTTGYVFVPGKGILGESCNMPTSTCTNEYRDVR